MGSLKHFEVDNLFWVIGRSFVEMRVRSQVVREAGRRDAYAGLKDVIFSKTATS